MPWCPEQIAGWLKRTYLEDDSYQVSHETIYRFLFVQARSVLNQELQQYLRSSKSIRRFKQSSLKGDGLGGMPNAVSIRKRPATVEDRAVLGHWQGDLIEGSHNSRVASLVERHSRYLMLIKQVRQLAGELYKSLSWDWGVEIEAHQRFTLATNIQVYFCDPQSRWQRGTNENSNRLLRQYLLKATDLSVYSQSALDKIARQLNQKPRKTLDYETPTARFNDCVASIG